VIPGLQAVRWRIAGWYAGIFSLVLAILGGGLFLTLRWDLDRELDRELVTLATDLERDIRLRIAGGSPEADAVRLGLEAFDSPGRPLTIIDASGEPVGNATLMSADVRRVAQAAIAGGAARAEFTGVPGQRWRVYGLRSDALTAPAAILSLADVAQTEARQARRAEIFVVFGVLALGLVAVAGAQLTRISLKPIAESYEQRRQFMAEAAHELRTPVALLRGTLEPALARRRDASADAATLKVANATAGRLSRLLDQMFLLARVDAGERPVRPADVFLDDIVSDACAAFSAPAEERGITLSLVEFAETPVRGDPDLLWQLAAVLLDNALKFTPPGGAVSVRVGTAGTRAVFSVSDNGPGIPAADQAHIFERFHRTPSARATTSGAGLGLAVAAWIAGEHDATIAVRSHAGAGATFDVSFPVRKPAPAVIAT
jgi:signal transduction histidine kinase